MVDQAQLGIHMVWPNPLTNRFVDVQLHPSFWPAGQTAFAHAANGTGDLSAVGREAAVLFEKSHTIVNNRQMPPTTLFANLVVASFNAVGNFGAAACALSKSNGRAFLVAGDSGLVDVMGFVMNNERNGDTHLWASAIGSHVALRIRSATTNYAHSLDVDVQLG